MPARLNKALEEYLAELQNEWGRIHAIPTYGRLAEVFGLKSKNAVSSVLSRLEKEGYLKMTKEEIEGGGVSQPRWSPTPKFFRREFMRGKVTAGTPAVVDEETSDGDGAVSIDEYLIEQPGETSFYEVKDEAMTGAGFVPGDICVVRQTNTATAGTAVVAEVGGQLMLRRLQKSPAGGLYLTADNSKYPDIWPNGELHIRGEVVGMFRKL